MPHYEAVIIGHITEDVNIDHTGHTDRICGGAVLYSSASAFALGHRVAAVTRLADADRARLEQFTLPKEDVFVVPCERSTVIRNQYFTADKERRSCICLSRGTPFTMDDLPADVTGDIYQFAGLIVGDYPDEMLVQCAQKGAIAVDAQGFLRHADPETGEMYFKDWAQKKDLLPHVTYLKTDAAEAEILTGLTDRAEAAKLLHRWGAKEVLITHNTEVLAYDGSEICTCPIRARNLSGRTGRGDTTFAAYLTERLHADVPTALRVATATVSLKMETPGPFRGTRADVEAYIGAFYR
ncbi:MAG: ribokinase [Clostridia bacterium]|nr:ribokinase [Clostridia bacterium]